METDEQEDLLLHTTSDNEEFTDNEEFEVTRTVVPNDVTSNSCYDKLKFIFVGFLLLLTSTVLIVILPLYQQTMSLFSDAYTMLLFTSSTSCVLLLLIILVFGKVIGGLKENIAMPFTTTKTYRIGLLFGLSGFLVLYAQDMKRVMCHLQDPIKGIILVFSLVYYFFFCKKMLGLQKIFCATTIIVGLFTAVDYALCDEFRCRGADRSSRADDAGNWDATTHALWTAAYVCGLALWALVFTFLEGELVQPGEVYYIGPDSTLLATVSHMVDTPSRPLLHQESVPHVEASVQQKSPLSLSILFWLHFITLQLLLGLFWIVPLLSHNQDATLKSFWSELGPALGCHFSTSDHCHGIVQYTWIFVSSYLLFCLLSLKFLSLSESSVVTIAVTTAALPLSGLWWSLFKLDVQHGTAVKLLWAPAVNGELICCVLGLPIVLFGLALTFRAHFREKAVGKALLAKLQQQPGNPA